MKTEPRRADADKQTSRSRRLGLATKFFLVSVVITLITMAVFEGVDYFHQRRSLIGLHDALAQEAGSQAGGGVGDNHAKHLTQIRHSLRETLAVHLLHLAVTVAVLVITLNFAATRLLIKPIRQLLDGVRTMSRGKWDIHLPVKSHDEMGLLTAQFNAMANLLEDRVTQLRRAERLSSLAILVSKTNAELSRIERQMERAVSLVATSGASSAAALHLGLEQMRAEVQKLNHLRGLLDAEFYQTVDDLKGAPKANANANAS